MLQIRLRSVPSSEGHGAKPTSVDTVTVACPDHLVLADLPVAKCLGTATASSVVKSVGRRSRRTLGERVHFCVRCDFPIAVYGRLSPCDHAFCLDCARSDSICYLCDERIQKIQTIKIMEGIFICAAPHCLKSFLKKTQFESHIHETHANLLQSNADKDGNESEAVSAKQSTVLESTARAPLRPEFSPNSSFHVHDHEDKARHSQHRDQQPPWPIIQSKSPPPPFFGQVQNHLSEPQPDDNRPPGFERPGLQNHFPQQNFDTQGGMQQESGQSLDKQQGILSENPFPGYPHLLGHQLSHFAVNSNPVLAPQPFSYSPFPPEGAHFLYGAPYQMIRSDSAPEAGSEHGSLLGFAPGASAGMNLSEGFPRPWNMGAAVSFEPSGQGIVDGFSNMADPQGRAAFFQGDYGQNMGVPPSNMTPLRQTYGNGTGTGCERYES